MANPEDTAAPAVTTEPVQAAAPAAAPAEAPPVEAVTSEAKTEATPPPLPSFKLDDLPPIIGEQGLSSATISAAEAAEASADVEADAPWSMPRHLPLAASLAIAVALGAVAGVAGTAALKSDEPTTATIAATSASRALQDSMVRLEGELATLRAGIVSSQRSSGAQIGKLSERIERAEKAQAEPTAKLAKVMESLDRLEHRLPQQQAAVAPPAAPASDITGSVAAKVDAKPPMADGWRLLDVYAGRAVVEQRGGRLYEVVPGSNLPNLGRVEAIKREDGRVVVVTKNGVIAASIEPRRRPPYYYRD